MILIIDNYDSFTHNLYQYVQSLTDEEVRVVRNDRVSIEDIEEMNPSRIIISPGPGRPEDAGVSVDAIRSFAGSIPILGVCLGHQAIGHAFGAKISRAERIVHGKTEAISVDGRGLFRSVASPATLTRYHSLLVDADTLPPELEVTAQSRTGEVMGLRHSTQLVEGVQFHPESIASELGKKILSNFLHYNREPFVARDTLSAVMSGRHLSRHEAANFMEELTEGNLTPAQISAFLVALNMKGIQPEEIAGCAEVLQKKRVPISSDRPALDTCGTGGDGLGTFNISSLAALVAATCGARVAKHGNRAVSSKSGSADFYRALGINVDLPPSRVEELLNENDFAFLFAPLYHGAMRHAAGPRKELGVKTIMNLLGPLVNPAGASYQIIGVYDEALCEPMARAAHLLGIKRAWVVHGTDGLDELSVSAPSVIVSVNEDGDLDTRRFDPGEAGISGHSLEDLAGGEAAENARIALSLLRGEGPEAVADAVCLNAGAALVVSGIADDLSEAYRDCRNALTDGTARAKLDRTIELSHALAGGVEA
jgi:anthranilate synthase/phosphoribosyltransferase